MKIAEILLRPFSFLTIKHKSGVFAKILWTIPLTASFLIAITMAIFFRGIDIYGSSGIIYKTTAFIQNLPGFYIAALAAIATFGARNLNNLMQGSAPTMNIPFNGGLLTNEPLTRRLFLCSMFAYLTTLSFSLTLFGITVLSFADFIKSEIPYEAIVYIKFFFAFIYITFVLQLLFLTLWGIAYLGERMHISDAS